MDTDLRHILPAEDDPRDVEFMLPALLESLHVVKPVDFGEFVDAVRQVGVFWALLNEPAPVGQLQ
jgi:hypothetical protein